MTVFNPSIYRGVQEVRYQANPQRLTVWPEYQGKLLNLGVQAIDVSIYNPGQGFPEAEPIIEDAAGTQDSTTLQLYYDLNASNTSTYPLGEGYRAEWLFNEPTSPNPPRKYVTVFDVVRQPLVMYPPVRVDDLKTLHVQVHQQLIQQAGGAPTNLEDYAWAVYLMPAWQRVLDYVRGQGKRPALISPPDTFRAMLLHAAGEAMFRAFSRQPGDLYDGLSKQHAELYKEAKANTVLRYAEGDTHGHVPERAWAQPQLNIGPDVLGNPFIYRRRRV